MTQEYSFVETVIHFYKKGDKVYQAWLEEADCFDKPWEDTTQQIVDTSSVGSLFQDFDTLVADDFCTFKFYFFGQSLDQGYSSGLEWECQEGDIADVFSPYLDTLKELGLSILKNKKKQGLLKANNAARFITLWSYAGWLDSYYKEWESEWDLIGLVDPQQVFVSLFAKPVPKLSLVDLAK